MTTPLQQDGWTEQNCLDLIEEFKKRPQLWDPSHHLYCKQGLKPEAWEEIGRSLGVTGRAAKHKMIVLMSSFRREKYKILHSIRDAAKSADPSTFKLYKSSWYGFKKMSFMMDRFSKLKGNSKKDEEESEEMRLLKESVLEHFVEPDCRGRKHKKVPRTHSTEDADEDSDIMAIVSDEATVHFDEENNDQDNATSHTIRSHTSSRAVPSIAPAHDDEIKSFTDFIASKMRKLDEETKNLVQEQICGIIFRAQASDNRKRKSSISTADLQKSSIETEYNDIVGKIEIFD